MLRQIFTSQCMAVLRDEISLYPYFGRYRKTLKKECKATHKLHHLHITTLNFCVIILIMIFFLDNTGV
jgi:hypothetical protein